MGKAGKVKFFYEISNRKHYSETREMFNYLSKSGVSFEGYKCLKILGPEILITLPGERTPHEYYSLNDRKTLKNLERDLKIVKESPVARRVRII